MIPIRNPVPIPAAYLLPKTMKTTRNTFVDDDPYTDEELVELVVYSFDDLNKAASITFY